MIVFHTITGLLSLLSGLGILLLPKATRQHKLIGKIYVVSMYSLCLSSFAIQDTTPYFRGLGAFHLIAAIGTVYLTIGMIPLLFRSRMRNWWGIHFYCMLWSYVGLIMALNSHFFRPVLFFFVENFDLSRRAASLVSMAVLWGVPLVIGNIIINRKMPIFRKQFGFGNAAPDKSLRPTAG